MPYTERVTRGLRGFILSLPMGFWGDGEKGQHRHPPTPPRRRSPLDHRHNPMGEFFCVDGLVVVIVPFSLTPQPRYSAMQTPVTSLALDRTEHPQRRPADPPSFSHRAPKGIHGHWGTSLCPRQARKVCALAYSPSQRAAGKILCRQNVTQTTLGSSRSVPVYGVWAGLPVRSQKHQMTLCSLLTECRHRIFQEHPNNFRF